VNADHIEVAVMIGKREPTQFSFLNPAPPDSGPSGRV